MGISVKVAPGVRYHSSRSTGCLPIGLGFLAVATVIVLVREYWYIVVPALAAVVGLAVAARIAVMRSARTEQVRREREHQGIAEEAHHPQEARPAGWYADPYGHHAQRWWDGRKWTARTG